MMRILALLLCLIVLWPALRPLGAETRADAWRRQGLAVMHAGAVRVGHVRIVIAWGHV